MKNKRNNDDDDEDGDEDESDGEESKNWMKEFEAMKKAVNKPKDEPKKVESFPRRGNIAYQEVWANSVCYC